MDQVSPCALCGDVIGTYEPLLVVQEGGARETSYAAEPQIAQERQECYHWACYAAERSDEPANGEPR
jgi:hypothetical protein